MPITYSVERIEANDELLSLNNDESDLPNDVKKELLAKFIREKMNVAKLRSVELAGKANKRPSEITKWLSGKHNFTVDSIFLLEKLLGTTIINLGELAKKIEGSDKALRIKFTGLQPDVPKYCHQMENTFKTNSIKSKIVNTNIPNVFEATE